MSLYGLDARSRLIAEMKKLKASREVLEKGLKLIDAVYREIPNADSEAVVISVLRFLGADPEEDSSLLFGNKKWEDSEFFLPVISKLAEQNGIH